MKLYSCKVRLSGSLYNEVPKTDVTAAEVTLLQTLHGTDSVVQIYETGKNKVGQSDERSRLIEVYGAGLVAQQLAKTPDAAFAAVFGIAGRLPDDIPGAPKAPKSAAAPAPVAEPEDEDAPENAEE